jgi:hypothetical protein
MVIELEQQMSQLASGFNPDSARLWIIIHHVFVATVTLVMDYVCHRDDPQAAERKREILNCYKTLERSQEDSAIARRGLAHLKQVMRDWMTKSDGQSDRPAPFTETETPKPLATSNDARRAFVPQTQPLNMGSFPPAGDRLPETPWYSDQTNWMGFDVAQDISHDSFDFSGLSSDPQWEVLFRDLESQPIGYY